MVYSVIYITYRPTSAVLPSFGRKQSYSVQLSHGNTTANLLLRRLQFVETLLAGTPQYATPDATSNSFSKHVDHSNNLSKRTLPGYPIPIPDFLIQ